MAEVEMCEPWELFNLLNQQRNGVSRLAQSNYLCLFGKGEKRPRGNAPATSLLWECEWKPRPHPCLPPSLPPSRLFPATDAQEIHNYRTSHIITAKNIKQVWMSRQRQIGSRDQWRCQIQNPQQAGRGGNRGRLCAVSCFFFCLLFWGCIRLIRPNRGSGAGQYATRGGLWWQHRLPGGRR